MKPLKRDPVVLGRSDVQYVDIGSLDGPAGVLQEAPSVPAAVAPSRCRQVIELGDTLYSTVRPYLRKMALVGEGLQGEFASTGFCVLRPRPHLDPRFLYLWCQTDAFEQQILPLQKGVSYPAVLDKEVRSTFIDMPRLEVQRQVVELVEEHLSHLDAADASMVAGGARLAGVWHARAAGLLSDCAGEFVRLEDLLSEPLRNGRSDRASVDGTGVRCLTLTAITRREFIDRWTKVTVTPQAAAAALWLKCGDIFVQRSNTPELVGTSALYEGPPGWSIFPDLLIRVRVDPNLIDRHFLASVLRTDQVHRRLRAAAKGLAGSMPKIDQAAVADLLIPCPGLDVQRAIADDLQLLDQRIMQLRESVERQHLRSQALRRAVLAAAFSGRLTGHASDAEIIEETAEALPAQEALL